MHPFLLTKPTEASKSQKNDSKFSTKTKTMTFQNLNIPPPLSSATIAIGIFQDLILDFFHKYIPGIRDNALQTVGQFDKFNLPVVMPGTGGIPKGHIASLSCGQFDT